MIPLFLSISIPVSAQVGAPFTSLKFYTKLQQELNAAAQRQTITQQEADGIHKRCINTYTKGQ